MKYPLSFVIDLLNNYTEDEEATNAILSFIPIDDRSFVNQDLNKGDALPLYLFAQLLNIIKYDKSNILSLIKHVKVYRCELVCVLSKLIQSSDEGCSVDSFIQLCFALSTQSLSLFLYLSYRVLYKSNDSKDIKSVKSLYELLCVYIKKLIHHQPYNVCHMLECLCSLQIEDDE